MVKTFDADKLIQKHTFVEVSTDKLVDDGLTIGDRVYVVNLQALPKDEDDLYNQRLHIVGHKYLTKGEVDTTRILIIDPSNLIKISDKKNKALVRRLESRYLNESIN